MLKLLVIIVTIILCGLRIAGETSAAYQAAAHLWCGGLLGAGALSWWLLVLVRRALNLNLYGKGLILMESMATTLRRIRRFSLLLALGMIAVELLKFAGVL